MVLCARLAAHLMFCNFLQGGPWKPVPNYYPQESYAPAYRSAYFYSPWLHDPFGPKPFNPYASPKGVLNSDVNWPPVNAYRYPYTMPSFPLVSAQSAQAWGYPGFYLSYPAAYPGGGSPGFRHPSYPFHMPGFSDSIPRPYQDVDRQMPGQNYLPDMPGMSKLNKVPPFGAAPSETPAGLKAVGLSGPLRAPAVVGSAAPAAAAAQTAAPADPAAAAPPPAAPPADAAAAPLVAP